MILLKLSNHSSIFRERFYLAKTLVSVWTLQVLKPRTPARTRAHAVRWALESVPKLRETRETVPWVQGKILGICPVLKDSWWYVADVFLRDIYLGFFCGRSENLGFVGWFITPVSYSKLAEFELFSSPVIWACCGNKPLKLFATLALGLGFIYIYKFLVASIRMSQALPMHCNVSMCAA